MGREADAIGKLQGELADDEKKLAAGQPDPAKTKDYADIAAENAVLGDPTTGITGNQSAGSTATDTTSGGAATDTTVAGGGTDTVASGFATS